MHKYVKHEQSLELHKAAESVNQKPDPAFLNRKLCHCTSMGEGFPWETLMRSYWAVPNKALQRNTVSRLNMEQNSLKKMTT